MIIFLYHDTVNCFRLIPKLKSLMFKLRFPEIVQDCKPCIVSVTAACQEIMRSVKFARILELILLIGNIMNTGSRLEQSVGFDISYLPKLSNTKDAGNKFTLLHFVVETIESEQPDLLNFYEEILHLDRASKASFETIDKNLNQVEAAIKSLRRDVNLTEDEETADKFVEEMTSFVEEAESQFSILKAMRQKLDGLFKELAEFYVFDKSKYTIEDFFGDIKMFKDQFKEAHLCIVEERESQQRAQRARAAREKSMKHKEERNFKKQALVESVLEDKESGVMDSLLEALKTGTAFSRDCQRKRNARLAGGEQNIILLHKIFTTGKQIDNNVSAERRAQLCRTKSRGRMTTRSHSDVM